MSGRLTVLKLGSSVLVDQRAFERAALEIHGRVSAGERVVAVVSARPGVTDALVGAAHAAKLDERAAVRLVATGEVDSVRRLAATVRRTGIAVAARRGRDLGVFVAGRAEDAVPSRVDVSTWQGAFDDHAVIVVPGFVGCRDDGSLALLGRGGSDLTALMLARALGGRCRLQKDVDGLFEHDPNAAGPAAHRFARATWETALSRGGELVQPKALRYARDNEIAFDVGAIFGSGGTRIGRARSRLAPQARDGRRLRVALAGLGEVGDAVRRRLEALPERYELVGVAVRRPGARAGVAPNLLTCDATTLLDRAPDVIVEAIGGAQGVAATLIPDALDRGVHVVTANKALLSNDGAALRRRAREAGVTLGTSAAVGGGVPILETVAAGPVHRLTAVLNGTTSFLLERLGRGATTSSALAEAQQRGLAEADAGRDVDGSDACDKLAILIAAAFGASGAVPIAVAGLEDLDPMVVTGAAQCGRRVRLVAHAWRGPHGVQARIEPRVLERGAFLARGFGPACAIEVECADGSVRRVRGCGAGGAATSAAVIADLERVRAWQRLRAVPACREISA